MTSGSDDDLLLAELARRNWLILIVMVLLSLFWRSPAITTGVLAGGVLAIINYRWLGRSLLKVVSNPHPGAAKGFKFNYLFRLAFVASALYLLLVRGGIHPLGLAAGLAVIIINVMIATLKRLY